MHLLPDSVRDFGVYQLKCIPWGPACFGRNILLKKLQSKQPQHLHEVIAMAPGSRDNLMPRPFLTLAAYKLLVVARQVV